MSEKLLDVKNLHTSFFTHLGEVQAIRDVNQAVGRVLRHFLLWDCLHIREE